MIAASWIIGPLIGFTELTYELIEYDKSSRCFPKQVSFLVDLVVPILLAFFVTITLDAYLSIKAYQVYKKIQKENGEKKQMSKNKLHEIVQQKPMITLLVTISGPMPWK